MLRADVEDEHHNMTRFLIMAREPDDAPNNGKVVTTFVFRVKNVPAALYKAMGGFATNGVNMTKLESLSAGRLVQRHAILCRHPGPSRGSAGDAGAGGAGLFHVQAHHHGRLSGPSFPRRHARLGAGLLRPGFGARAHLLYARSARRSCPGSQNPSRRLIGVCAFLHIPLGLREFYWGSSA